MRSYHAVIFAQFIPENSDPHIQVCSIVFFPERERERERERAELIFGTGLSW